MPRKIKKQLAGKRPGGFGRWLKRLLVVLLLAILLTVGGAWLSGRLIMGRVAEALGRDGTAEVRAGLVVALPLVNLAYGRDLTIQLQGERPPVRISVKRFGGRLTRNETGGRVWSLDLGDVRFERGAGALAATRMSASGRYDRAAGLVELTDGRVEYLVLSAGRTAMTAFSRLSFKRLAFDARAGRLALGRGEGVLDLFWQVDQARLENFKMGLAFLDGYETPSLNVSLTGYNNEEQWALVLDMNTAREAAADLGDGQRRSVTGLLNKAVNQNLDMARLLRFDRLRLSCGGGWAEGEGETPGKIWTESVFLFPRLFTMTVNGLGPAVTRARAAEWLGGCFGLGEDGDRPRCLAALGFDTFSVDYGDRGLTFIMRPVKSFRDKIFGETDPSGPLGPPALGLALGLWLDDQAAKVPAGSFTFKTEDGEPLYPFRREFFAAVKDGSVEVLFTPPAQ